jgi:hypothetical protein
VAGSAQNEVEHKSCNYNGLNESVNAGRAGEFLISDFRLAIEDKGPIISGRRRVEKAFGRRIPAAPASAPRVRSRRAGHFF